MPDIVPLSTLLTVTNCQAGYTTRNLVEPLERVMDGLPDRVREARKRTKLSQEEFAAEIKVSRSAVANWETGNNAPDINNLVLIAVRSGLAFEYLCTGRGPPVFGEPTRVAEARAPYVLDRTEKEISRLLSKAPARIKRAVLELLRMHAGE